jgi:hypothetical protein
MPKISITISDYTYWKLSGTGETASTVVQKALKHYWQTYKKRKETEN